MVFESNIYALTVISFNSWFFNFIFKMREWKHSLWIWTSSLWEKYQQVLRQWEKNKKHTFVFYKPLWHFKNPKRIVCLAKLEIARIANAFRFVLAWHTFLFSNFDYPLKSRLKFFNIHIHCLRKNAWVEKGMRIWHLIIKSIHVHDLQKLGTI